MLFQQQMAALRNNLEQLQRQRQQQQGQTQPPQAQAGQPQQPNNNNNNNGIPPNLFNMMAGGAVPPLPPFPFHPPQQPQQQPGAAGGQPTSAAGSAGASAASAGSGPAGPRSPFMFPPPFPFVPFTVPPPQPPPNFSGMSEAELREMEGVERNNVEARIRCLRNIQVRHHLNFHGWIPLQSENLRVETFSLALYLISYHHHYYSFLIFIDHQGSAGRRRHGDATVQRCGGED